MTRSGPGRGFACGRRVGAHHLAFGPHRRPHPGDARVPAMARVRGPPTWAPDEGRSPAGVAERRRPRRWLRRRGRGVLGIGGVRGGDDQTTGRRMLFELSGTEQLAPGSGLPSLVRAIAVGRMRGLSRGFCSSLQTRRRQGADSMTRRSPGPSRVVTTSLTLTLAALPAGCGPPGFAKPPDRQAARRPR
jgi:hypothetical protein